MIKYLRAMFLILFMFCVSFATATPLNLKWDKEYEVLEVPKGYKYYMGSLSWGQWVFVGTKDIAGMQPELQVNFARKRIATALLILGPEGIDEHNCVIKYKQVVRMLNKKYGLFVYKEIEKDPVIDELIYAAACYPVKLGLYSVRNVWRNKLFIINSRLIGDDEGFYIEILYTNRASSKLYKNLKAVKDMNSL